MEIGDNFWIPRNDGTLESSGNDDFIAVSFHVQESGRFFWR